MIVAFLNDFLDIELQILECVKCFFSDHLTMSMTL